jgi:hypothetical protein
MQGDSFRALHNHADMIFGAKSGIKAYDVGVVQARVQHDFPEEAISETGIGLQLGTNHFHGFDSAGKHVLHPEHLAHATFTKNVEYLVAVNRIAYLKFHCDFGQ